MPLANLFVTNLLIAFNVNRFCGSGKLYYLSFIVASNKTIYSYLLGGGGRKKRSEMLQCFATIAIVVCVLQGDFQWDDIFWLGKRGDSSLEDSLLESSAWSNLYLFATNIKTQYYFTFNEFFKGLCFVSELEGIFTSCFFLLFRKNKILSSTSCMQNLAYVCSVKFKISQVWQGTFHYLNIFGSLSLHQMLRVVQDTARGCDTYPASKIHRFVGGFYMKNA